jgi:hypothetical protein
MSLDQVVEQILNSESIGDLVQQVFFEQEDQAPYPEAPGLPKQSMALAAHKGYIHDRAGNKHELTDKQRRFFFAKMRGKYRKYLANAQRKEN